MSDLIGSPDEEVVGALMSELLEHIVGVFEQANVDLPERRYLHIGRRTVHDCEQLTVAFQQLYSGPPGDRGTTPHNCHSPRSVVLTVELVRRVAMPSGRGTTPPPADEVTDRTLKKTRDAWMLLDAALSMQQEYLGGVLADVAVTEVQGEYQAVVLNVTAGVP